VIKKVLVLAVATFVALLVLEGGVRLLGLAPRVRERMHEFDPVLGWRKLARISVAHAPDRGNEFACTLVTNSAGLRDDEIPEGKPEGETRILFLGDSFTLGYTVERKDLFVDLLEKRLRKDGRKLECINGGTEGYSTDQCALFYDHVGSKYRPDLVVYVFYQNDVYWNTHAMYLGFPKPRFQKQPDGSYAPPPTRLVDNKAGDPGLRDWSAIWRMLARPSLPMASVTGAHGTVPLPEEFCVNLVNPPPFVADAYATTEGILAWLKARCAKDHARLALLLIPDKADIYSSDLEQMLAQYKLGTRDWDRGRPVRELNRMAKALGLPCLDLTPGFVRAAGGTKKLYYDSDRHLTPDGNAQLTEQLALQVKNWLP
jgi:lysophospholipase L1-like esterase